MATKKEEQKIRFEFTGHYHSDLLIDRYGRVKCDICEKWSKYVHVGVVLDDFLICPTCVLSGPQALATEVSRIAGDKDYIARKWGYPDTSLGRQDIAGMARAYRSLAKVFRGIGSFEDLPGGTVAMAVAKTLLAPAAGRKRRAA